MRIRQLHESVLECDIWQLSCITLERVSSVAAVGIIMLDHSSRKEDLHRLIGQSSIVLPIEVRGHAQITYDQDYPIPVKFTGKLGPL